MTAKYIRVSGSVLLAVLLYSVIACTPEDIDALVEPLDPSSWAAIVARRSAAADVDVPSDHGGPCDADDPYEAQADYYVGYTEGELVAALGPADEVLIDPGAPSEWTFRYWTVRRGMAFDFVYRIQPRGGLVTAASYSFCSFCGIPELHHPPIDVDPCD